MMLAVHVLVVTKMQMCMAVFVRVKIAAGIQVLVLHESAINDSGSRQQNIQMFKHTVRGLEKAD